MAEKWTPEMKAQVKEKYLAGEPTPENSAELVKEIADEMGESANGVRMILIQEKVYVKKDAAGTTGKTGGTTKKTGEGTKRVSKDDQIAELRAAIEEKGAEVDEEILGKLTGKAAAYFTKVLTA